MMSSNMVAKGKGGVTILSACYVLQHNEIAVYEQNSVDL